MCGSGPSSRMAVRGGGALKRQEEHMTMDKSLTFMHIIIIKFDESFQKGTPRSKIQKTIAGGPTWCEGSEKSLLKSPISCLLHS